MRIEESALIVRMKFTTKPGEQWVIRCEAYSRIRYALAEAGIFFAHREVRVRLPEEQGLNELPDKSTVIKETLTKAGAAAGDVESADAQKRNKIDFDNDL